MKKYIIVLLILSILLTGCSHTKVEPISDDGWTGEIITDIPGYGEYSDAVDKIIQDSMFYFLYVKKAYENSDGEKLKTFKLSESASTYLEDIQSVDTSVKLTDNGDYNETMILLKIQEKVLRANVKVNELNLLLSTNKNAKNKKWFTEMRETLLDAKEFYTNGDYLQTE